MENRAEISPLGIPLNKLWSPALLSLVEHSIQMFFLPLLTERRDSEWRPVEQLVLLQGSVYSSIVQKSFLQWSYLSYVETECFKCG